MSNAIILGGSGGGSTINGRSNVLRVKDGEEVKKGDFITFDYYSEVITSSKNKTSDNIIDGYSTSYISMDEDTKIRARIKDIDCFANKDQWRFDINSSIYYNDTIRKTCCPNYNGGPDKEMNIALSVIFSDGTTKDITITRGYWVGVPRLYKMSNSRFLLSYYAVKLAEMYCIEFSIFDINAHTFEIEEVSNTCRVTIANQHSTIPDYSWYSGKITRSYPAWYYEDSTPNPVYDYGYTRSTDRYDISIINDSSFYLWYGTYDGDKLIDNKHSCADLSEKYTFSEGILSCVSSKVSSNSGLKSGSSNIYSHFDIGRLKHITENVSLQQEYTGKLNGTEYWLNYLYFGKDALVQSDDHPKVLISKRSTEDGPWKTNSALGDRIWSPMQFKSSVPAFYSTKKGAAAVCYLEKYLGVHYVLSAHYGTFTNPKNDYELCEDVLHITLTQYNEIDNTSKIEIMAVPRVTTDASQDTTADSGKIIIKRISNNLFLLIENAMTNTRNARIFLIGLAYNPNNTNSRWSLRSPDGGRLYTGSTFSIYDSYIQEITEPLLSLEETKGFRTNESNILVVNKTLVYRDYFIETTPIGGAHSYRKFYYVYKIMIVDCVTGKEIELLLPDENSIPKIDSSGKHDYKETVVKAARTDGIIMGVSLQNAKSLQPARVKEVYGLSSKKNRCTLCLDGVTYYENTMPIVFKNAYNEAQSKRLFGKDLLDYIQDKCKF